MSLFSEIKLEWGNKTYIVAPERVMRLIAIIENTITMLELNEHAQAGTHPMAKIATAYADALCYAGANVTAEETYNAWFNAGENKGVMASAIGGLLAMMIPPSSVAEAQEGSVESGKQKDGTSSLELPTLDR